MWIVSDNEVDSFSQHLSGVVAVEGRKAAMHIYIFLRLSEV